MFIKKFNNFMYYQFWCIFVKIYPNVSINNDIKIFRNKRHEIKKKGFTINNAFFERNKSECVYMLKKEKINSMNAQAGQHAKYLTMNGIHAMNILLILLLIDHVGFISMYIIIYI